MSKKGKNANIVFYVSVLLTVAFIIWGIFFTESLSAITDIIFDGTIEYFGWVYLSAALFFVLFSVYLLLSKYGHIRLGKKTDKPEFKTISWLAMLFAAGTGVGILFWSVAEPVFHYTSPPTGEGYTEAAANVALKYSFFHWGFHPWAIYTVIGLALAFFQFNKQLPALVSSAFYPLLKDKIHGPIGKTIDILAVFATVFGIATSLGLGAMQVSGGLHSLFNIPNTLAIQITVIVVATILYLISISTGLERGIQYLSNTAMVLSFLIMLLVLVMGPTFTIFKVFFNTMGGYVDDFISMSLNAKPFGDNKWNGSWTLFYWAWWIAWAPFVGLFIARISKGRTIREFVIGVLFVPALGTFVWLSIFGGSALHLIHNLGQKELAQQVISNVDLSMFRFFDYLPASSVLNIIGFAVVIIYYITVADSSTFVLGMLSESGNLNPSNRIKITWGIIQSMVAAVLLLAGGLEVLQTASIAVAFPFAIIMVFMCWSLYKGLKNEVKEDKISEPKEKIS
ncbi:BCCT family transporter [Peribacillus sp. NPDC096379]|uniref:glycine betaine uptake BCCT transporter n=1 Tax=Peribacillus sp. NPDC096379 TaxID=3364393 RepID=UPI003817A876